MLFGALHGILLLPVLLSLSDGCFTRRRKPAPQPLHFADHFGNQFSMGIGPPFSKYPSVAAYPPPSLGMSGPAFGGVPLPPAVSFGFPANNKKKSKADLQAMSEANRLALYQSQFAFLPVGFDAAPYAVGPAFAFHPHLNLFGRTEGFSQEDRDKKQFKHSKLIPFNGK